MVTGDTRPAPAGRVFKPEPGLAYTESPPFASKLAPTGIHNDRSHALRGNDPLNRKQSFAQFGNLIAHLRRCFEFQIPRQLVHFLFQRADAFGDFAW